MEGESGAMDESMGTMSEADGMINGSGHFVANESVASSEADQAAPIQEGASAPVIEA